MRLRGWIRTKEITVRRRQLFDLLGVLLTVIGFVLSALTLLMQTSGFSDRYSEVLAVLADLENAVAAIPDRRLITVAILLIYLMKAVIPIPLSAVCVIAGMVFPLPLAVAINTAGTGMLAAIRYFWGKHLGRGAVFRMFSGQNSVQRVFESDSSAAGGLLLCFRAIPLIPLNTVSQLYGTVNFGFLKYMILSVIGFMPRAVSYSMAGHSVFNPFSFSFMLALIILFEVSGAAVISVNVFIEIYNRRIKSL